jgi:hypothetical protein
MADAKKSDEQSSVGYESVEGPIIRSLPRFLVSFASPWRLGVGGEERAGSSGHLLPLPESLKIPVLARRTRRETDRIVDKGKGSLFVSSLRTNKAVSEKPQDCLVIGKHDGIRRIAAEPIVQVEKARLTIEVRLKALLLIVRLRVGDRIE